MNSVKIPTEQQLLSYTKVDRSKIILDDEDLPIKFLQLEEGSEISVKNIGKQIRWDYVFYLEYLGPIIIIPVFYFLGKRDKYTLIQPVAATMGVAHYIKR